MGYFLLSFALIFILWFLWSLRSGCVNVYRDRWFGLGARDYGHFSRHHDPVRYWIAMGAIGGFAVYLLVLTVIAHFMDLAW